MQKQLRAVWAFFGVGILGLTLFGVVFGLALPVVPPPADQGTRACRVQTDSPVHLYNGPGADYQISLRVAVPAELSARVRSSDQWYQVIWAGRVGWLSAEDVAAISGDCAALPLPTAAPPLLAQAPASAQSCIARANGTTLTLYSAADAAYPVTVALSGDARAVVEGRTTNAWLLLRVEEQGNIFQGYAPSTTVTLQGSCEALKQISGDPFAAEAGISTSARPETCTLTSRLPFAIFAAPDTGARVLLVLSPHTALPVMRLVNEEWAQVILPDDSSAYAKIMGALLSGGCSG